MARLPAVDTQRVANTQAIVASVADSSIDPGVVEGAVAHQGLSEDELNQPFRRHLKEELFSFARDYGQG